MSILFSAAACRSTDGVSGTSLNSSGKTYEIYLTFDDGPWHGTDDVLRNLKGEGDVPATFFLCGYVFNDEQGGGNVSARRGYLREMLGGGHLIANHSYSHKYNYDDPSWMLADFAANEGAIQAQLDAEYPHEFACFARLPGRRAWDVDGIHVEDDGDTDPTVSLLTGREYNVYGWDAEWEQKKEWKGCTLAATGTLKQTPEGMAEETLKALRKGDTKKPGKAVVLSHDVLFRESQGMGDKLGAYIRALREQAAANNETVTFRTLRDY